MDMGISLDDRRCQGARVSLYGMDMFGPKLENYAEAT